MINATAILLVAAVLGVTAGWEAVLALPVVYVTGLTFASLAMIVTAVSRSYDFFMYYFTLVITPMLLLSGVFFPLQTLPPLIAKGALCLPLAHSVALIRPLVIGGQVHELGLHLLVLMAFCAGGLGVSIRLFRKRLTA